MPATGPKPADPSLRVHGVADAVADAVGGNWVDTLAPASTRPYLRLSRADRPIGTWLLLLPCWWGIALAMLAGGNPRWGDLWIALGCGMGAWLMRGAGCTWNDITDRDFDGAVARTRSRPIPSGAVTAKQALAWGIAQSLLAFCILLTFNTPTIALGVLSLVPVTIYPFAKRFTWWPQVFLGLAFNWGAILAWTAHSGAFDPRSLILYVAGIAWTLFYDTIYAHQDTEDDALIGVKSTARLFGEHSPRWLRAFLAISVALMALTIWLVLPADAPSLQTVVTMAAPLAFGAHMVWQLVRFDPNDQDGLLVLFRSNRNAGLIPLILLLLAAAL
ncbi:4-hydroxybenzoate octaprenyltransferase [Chachezhania sediminis]|uniref:4-hydroxybenzoate octaprenyltransferase n=1 Tax=Chachezhania sediminis TaxID=2599291 RepID=UPI00131B079B|nr:4-hydroxybenzoate octaprenyltransferase [Chachezhania sediminis]